MATTNLLPWGQISLHENSGCVFNDSICRKVKKEVIESMHIVNKVVSTNFFGFPPFIEPIAPRGGGQGVLKKRPRQVIGLQGSDCESF